MHVETVGGRLRCRYQLTLNKSQPINKAQGSVYGAQGSINRARGWKSKLNEACVSVEQRDSKHEG